MDRGVFVALSGALAQEKRMELLSDNLANVNTAGFKKQNAVFADSFPAVMSRMSPRVYSTIDDIVTDMTPGVLEKTDRSLDMAIEGDGFFVVETPQGNRYTRDGSFTISSNGVLMTREGFPLVGEQGEISLTGSDIAVDPDGTIENNGIAAGRLKLVTFKDTSGLMREGHMFAQRVDASTVEVPVGPETRVIQGYVESSNVNAVRAMTEMIEAMRSYETHAKMIKTMDDMTRRAIDEVGRAG